MTQSRASQVARATYTIILFALVGPLIGALVALFGIIALDQRGMFQAVYALFSSKQIGRLIVTIVYLAYLFGGLPAAISGVAIAVFDARQLCGAPRWLISLVTGFVVTAGLSLLLLPRPSTLNIGFFGFLLSSSAVGALSAVSCHFLTRRFSRRG